jgi:uncharacterized protein YdcH (DUF465 family)
MEQWEEVLIREHADHDEELKSLYREHEEFKQRLESFRDKLHLSNDEEIEKKRLQKLKLACKDRMMEILARYR